MCVSVYLVCVCVCVCAILRSNTLNCGYFQETGLKLTEEEIEFLVEDLDKDGDGEINYR